MEGFSACHWLGGQLRVSTLEYIARSLHQVGPGTSVEMVQPSRRI